MRRTRSMRAVRDHPAYAAAAALTAASTSRSPESGTCSMISPVAGLKMGSDATPSADARQSGPMRLRIIDGSPNLGPTHLPRVRLTRPDVQLLALRLRLQ